jgi:hypothetical protein
VHYIKALTHLLWVLAVVLLLLLLKKKKKTLGDNIKQGKGKDGAGARKSCSDC